MKKVLLTSLTFFFWGFDSVPLCALGWEDKLIQRGSTYSRGPTASDLIKKHPSELRGNRVVVLEGTTPDSVLSEREISGAMAEMGVPPKSRFYLAVGLRPTANPFSGNEPITSWKTSYPPLAAPPPYEKIAGSPSSSGKGAALPQSSTDEEVGVCESGTVCCYGSRSTKMVVLYLPSHPEFESALERCGDNPVTVGFMSELLMDRLGHLPWAPAAAQALIEMMAEGETSSESDGLPSGKDAAMEEKPTSPMSSPPPPSAAAAATSSRDVRMRIPVISAGSRTASPLPVIEEKPTPVASLPSPPRQIAAASRREDSGSPRTPLASTTAAAAASASLSAGSLAEALRPTIPTVAFSPPRFGLDTQKETRVKPGATRFKVECSTHLEGEYTWAIVSKKDKKSEPIVQGRRAISNASLDTDEPCLIVNESFPELEPGVTHYLVCKFIGHYVGENLGIGEITFSSSPNGSPERKR